jgi:hypothetical protein
LQCHLLEAGRVHLNQGDMLENVGPTRRCWFRRRVRTRPGGFSDIPAITSEMVDWVVNSAMQTDHDLYYNVITRQVMEARYPNSRRSYVKLKDMEVCGGDMNVIRALTVTANDDLWRRIVAARKSALKQAALVGFDTLILLLRTSSPWNRASVYFPAPENC